MIFRVHEGDIIETNCCVLPACSAFMAESLALRKAIQMTLDLDIQQICFETDCESLALAVNNSKAVPERRSEAIVADIISLKQKIPKCSVVWASRSANTAADWLANFALKGT